MKPPLARLCFLTLIGLGAQACSGNGESNGNRNGDANRGGGGGSAAMGVKAGTGGGASAGAGSSSGASSALMQYTPDQARWETFATKPFEGGTNTSHDHALTSSALDWPKEVGDPRHLIGERRG